MAFSNFKFYSFYYLSLFHRFRSVNCTIGPGSSEWFAVESQHTEKLRRVVLDNHRVDIFGKEGSWFLSPEFLVKHQIPFLHGTVCIVASVIIFWWYGSIEFFWYSFILFYFILFFGILFHFVLFFYFVLFYFIVFFGILLHIFVFYCT